jgi:hypothetical protein
MGQCAIALKHAIEHRDPSYAVANVDKQYEYHLLHLSVAWVSGLKIIWEAYPGLSNSRKCSVLGNAIRGNHIKSVEFLINHGLEVSICQLEWCKSESIRFLIWRTFIERRQRLLKLARTNLPEESQAMLGIRDGKLPDQNVGGICKELDIRRIPIPLSLRSQSMCSVFYCNGLSIDTLEALYEEGFRDMDYVTVYGYSVVLDPWHFLQRRFNPTVSEFTTRAIWFMSKNALMRIPPWMAHTTAEHILALRIVGPVVMSDRKREHNPASLPMEQRDFVKSALGTMSRDSCSCFCSISGCTPLSIAFRALLRRKSSLYMSIPPDVLRDYILEMQRVSHSAGTIIRMLTFTDLGLTHTCCKLRLALPAITPMAPDLEDAEEIHEEERFFLWELELLVQEMEEEYEDLYVSLWEYIQDYWCTRVREFVLQRDGVLSPSLWCIKLAKSTIEE